MPSSHLHEGPYLLRIFLPCLRTKTTLSSTAWGLPTAQETRWQVAPWNSVPSAGGGGLCVGGGLAWAWESTALRQ
jgi:hypothetical protein